ncbi:MAG: carbohydrate binding domain-containing protein [Sedimentisphaerales bacterium]|nr:carbohydrate binding domain-containing protein [Sedimentisphaerales bacterium]
MKVSKALILIITGFIIISPVEAQLSLTVHTDQTTGTISDGIYGQFLEHIFNSVHGGLWGDQILNGTLEVSPAGNRRGGRGRRGSVATNTINPPRNWEFVGDFDEVSIDRDNPFNADVSIKIQAKVGGDSATGPGICQNNIALKEGEKYTLSFYAYGSGTISVGFSENKSYFLQKNITGLTGEWKKYVIEFTASKTINAASLTIGSPPSGIVNIDQISLFSDSSLTIGGYRPDLYKAIADLKPASIRWPGGSFANRYIWQNAIGPREKRLPHPTEQWNDRDTYQFGTDEFCQFCEKVGAEPILVLNTARGVEDALNWLEYCMGDTTTEYGRMRAENGHPEPYVLKTLEIDNEPWLMMEYPRYLEIVKNFCPPIREKYPNLKLSVAGSYGYDTGPGEGNQQANRNWDPRIIEDAGTLFDILSPHYYNGIAFEPDFSGDPYRYEEFLRGRGEIIKKSENPDIKIYVSEWNLTTSRYKNDWHVGLYAGGILNAFERLSDIVTMTCPALFMRKQGVTDSWDNALINFDQSTWFPAGNYVVMKMWRDSFAPNLLSVDGPDRPLNFVATRSEDKKTVFLKAVNPTDSAIETSIILDGDFVPGSATMQMVAPEDENTRNSLEQSDNIKVIPSAVVVENKIVKFSMPAFSVGVVKVTQ